MFETRIKALRTSLGLNQVEFAAQLSVTKQSVSNWENGNILPSLDMLMKIAYTYSVSADYLLGIDNKKTLDITDLDDRAVALLQELADRLKK